MHLDANEVVDSLMLLVRWVRQHSLYHSLRLNCCLPLSFPCSSGMEHEGGYDTDRHNRGHHRGDSSSNIIKECLEGIQHCTDDQEEDVRTETEQLTHGEVPQHAGGWPPQHQWEGME